MSAPFDVAVVGAGIIGAATAFHLAEVGARVVVYDASREITGASAKSTGMVRVHQPDMELARLSYLGWSLFPPSLLTTAGCVHDVTGRSREEVEAEASEVRSWGAPCDVVGAAELKALYPDVWWPEGTLAVHETRSGWADGDGCRRHWFHGVLARGGALRLGDEGHVRALDELGAAAVVVATGAWIVDSGLLPPAGGAVPVRTRRILWQQALGPRQSLPCYVREGPEQLYFRAERDGGLRFGAGCDDWDVSPAAAGSGGADAALLAKGRARVRVMVGDIGDTTAVLSAADGYTGDGRPLIGAWPGADGVYVALGFSGGGFKMAPAVGRLLASFVTTAERPEVLAPYAVDRAVTS